MSLFIISFVFLPLFSKATIKFKEEAVNFGKVDEDKFANLQFEFENIGDSLLVIKRLLPSCGCTTVGLKKKEYKPGEKGVIPIKFKPKGYYSHVTKVITVHTNDEARPTIRLRLSGEVIVKFFAQPELETKELDFGEVEVGKRYEKQIKIKNSGTIDLEMTEAIHPPEIIPEFSSVRIKPNQEGDLLIVLKPTKAGKFQKWLRIRNNSYKKRVMMLKVNATVK